MLVVFSKLRISDEDRNWIERIRARHDPQHGLVPAHVTFVFPFAGTPADEVAAHAAEVAAETAPIAFVLGMASAAPDPLSPVSRVLLLPVAGAEPMRALHGRLYAGVLARHLREDIAFEPHVTVGAFDDQDDARRLAASAPPFSIGGSLLGLTLAEFDGDALTELGELRFGR
jgi:2'-5' RNA ligase